MVRSTDLKYTDGADPAAKHRRIPHANPSTQTGYVKSSGGGAATSYNLTSESLPPLEFEYTRG
ncbi:MAG: hypothetical protein WKF84_19140 [Pyrinomonadaceae bacterium]